jgi:hypothetical protein
MKDLSTLPIGAQVAVLYSVRDGDSRRVELEYGNVSKRHKDNTFVVKTDDGETIRFLSYGLEYGRKSWRIAHPVTDENREWWARTVEYVNDEYRPTDWYRPKADTVISMIEKMEKERAVARFWNWFGPVWESRQFVGEHTPEGVPVHIDRATISGEFTHSGRWTYIFFVTSATGENDLFVYAILPGDESAQASHYRHKVKDSLLTPEILYDCLRGFPLYLDKE